jgi:hypothetical protein
VVSGVTSALIKGGFVPVAMFIFTLVNDKPVLMMFLYPHAPFLA